MSRRLLVFLVAALLLSAAGAQAKFAFRVKGAVASGGGGGYTDFCSQGFVGGSCTYVYDLQQRRVSTNTVPFQVTRLSDSTTFNGGYTGSTFGVNTSALTTFCLGHGGSTTNLTYSTQYNDCVFTTVYDQTGSGCDLVAGGPSALGTTHAPFVQIRLTDNLPAIIQSSQAPSTSPSAKWLFKNGCTQLDGNVPRTEISIGNNAYFSACCGQYGKIETNPPLGLTPAGAMWSTFYFHSGANVDYGTDIEGGGACTSTTAIPVTPVIDDVSLTMYSTTAGGSNIYYNDTLLDGANCTPHSAIATQDGMVIGCSGDYTACGPLVFRGMMFLNIDVSLTAGLHTQIFNALNTSLAPVTAVHLSNENLTPGMTTGSRVGDLSALQGVTACGTCTFSMVNSGPSSDGNLPVICSAASNDFQVVSTGPGTATLQNATVINTAQIYGQVPPVSPTKSYICVQAMPASGAAFIMPFSIMVRNPTFTSFAPLAVQYTSGIGKTVPLSTTICWLDCQQSGPTPTVTYTLGGDAACVAAGISISGTNLIFSSSYAGSGICHITATAPGVATGMIGTGSPSYVAAVYISQGAYVGPGDATYANGATGLPWTIWTGLYAYNAAYATAGSPVMQVQRESDGTTFTINALSNGDMDTGTLAQDCDTSICYARVAYDQSGSGNNMLTWGDSNGAGITTRHPVVVFDAFNGAVMVPTNSNSTDRGWWNPTAYNGSGSSGTLWIDGAEDAGLFGGPLIEMNDTSVSSPLATQLSLNSGGGAQLYVGPDNGSGSKILGAATGTGMHSLIGVIPSGGTGSVLKVDGTETTGTLTVPSLVKPLGFGMTYGGGSLQGFLALPGAISPTSASTQQRQALCQFDQQHFGTPGSC